jgi:hypothetical protein
VAGCAYVPAPDYSYAPAGYYAYTPAYVSYGYAPAWGLAPGAHSTEHIASPGVGSPG